MVKVSYFSIIASFCLIAFSGLAVLYYYFFSQHLVAHNVQVNDYFLSALNTHDHFVYVDTIENIRNGGISIGLNNNSGISLIYIALSEVFAVEENLNWKTFSLKVNIFVIILSFIYYVKIHSFLGISRYWSLLFFLNTPLLYFSQLINKDSFTIFSFLIILYYLLKKRFLILLCLLPLFFLIRIQLAIFLLILIFSVAGKHFPLRIFLAYTATSLMGGLIARYSLVIANESIPEGFSRFVYVMNESYLIGNLLLNPIRALQFIQALLASFDFRLSGVVDFSRLINIPQVVIVLLVFPYFISAFFTSRYYRNSIEKTLLGFIYIYIFVWLMNPTINIRYVLLITPIMILLAIYKKTKKVEYV
jgi:hypothetical protein